MEKRAVWRDSDDFWPQQSIINGYFGGRMRNDPGMRQVLPGIGRCRKSQAHKCVTAVLAR